VTSTTIKQTSPALLSEVSPILWTPNASKILKHCKIFLFHNIQEQLHIMNTEVLMGTSLID
jgi:hypothetical protein